MSDFYIQKKKCKFLTGFTLVETLVAVTILLAVVAGPIALIARALFSVSFSRNNLIAQNLAQEGIELIRAIRDNNVLCASLDGGATSWDKDPEDGGGPPTLRDYYEIDALDNIALTSPLCAGIMTPRPTNRNVNNCDTPIRTHPNGIYTYIAGTPTIFSRCVRACSPPNAPPCSVTADVDVPSDDQMEIISTVLWMEHGAQKSITLRDRLYWWK